MPSERVTCSAASLAPGVRGPGQRSESYFKKQTCCNPRCSKLQEADFPNPAPPPPSPGPEPTDGLVQGGGPPENAPTRSRAQVQWRESPKAEPSQSRPGRDRAAGYRPPAWYLREILAISRPAPLFFALALPAGSCDHSYLQRSRARPRSARPNPNPCCGLPAGSPQPPVRGALGPASCSGCRVSLGPGSARRPRPGAARQRRAPPAPGSPRSPAGACARGERGAEGGARWESAGRRAGRRELGGAGASGAPGAPDWG